MCVRVCARVASAHVLCDQAGGYVNHASKFCLLTCAGMYRLTHPVRTQPTQLRDDSHARLEICNADGEDSNRYWTICMHNDGKRVWVLEASLCGKRGDKHRRRAGINGGRETGRVGRWGRVILRQSDREQKSEG